VTDDVPVPRVSETVDDRTPITASRIDVAARIGWMMRTHRSVAGLSLREMSAALKEHGAPLSAATLSRIESEGQRSPAALDGYERALGLSDGALRAPVDLMCRTFPYAPEVVARPAPPTLERFSLAFEAIDVASPTGGAWLELARQHSGTGVGLPRTLMEPQVRRLSLELTRSTGLARFTRLESLALLRCSAYGDLVDEVVRGLVLAPHAQNTWDLLVVLAERPTPSLLDWMATLLRHESTYLARGASYGLQAMLVRGGLGLEEWTGLLPHLELAWHEADGDPARRAVLAQLWAALPPQLQARAQEACRQESAAPPGPTVWTRSRQNRHYLLAESLAGAATGLMGHPEEPLLARLLFEAMFDPRGVRMSHATSLLAFSPFADALVRVLLEPPTGPLDVGVAAGLRVAAFCHTGEVPAGVRPLLASESAIDLQHVLTFFSHGSRPLPQPTLDRGLAGDEITVRRTLYCLGLTGDQRLSGLAADPALPASTRGGAGWWVETGPRIDR